MTTITQNYKNTLLKFPGGEGGVDDTNDTGGSGSGTSGGGDR